MSRPRPSMCVMVAMIGRESLKKIRKYYKKNSNGSNIRHKTSASGTTCPMQKYGMKISFTRNLNLGEKVQWMVHYLRHVKYIVEKWHFARI